MRKIIYNNNGSDLRMRINYILNGDSHLESAINDSQIIYLSYEYDVLVSYYKRENIIVELCVKNDSQHDWKNKDFIISIDGKKYFAKNTGERIEIVDSEDPWKSIRRRRDDVDVAYKKEYKCTVYQVTTITDDEILELGVDLEKYRTHCLKDGRDGFCTIKSIEDSTYQIHDKFIEKLEFGEDLSLDECIEIVKLLYPKMNKYKDFKESFYRHSALDLKKVKVLEYMESLKPEETTTLKSIANELDIPVNVVDWASCCSEDFRAHFKSYRKHAQN